MSNSEAILIVIVFCIIISIPVLFLGFGIFSAALFATGANKKYKRFSSFIFHLTIFSGLLSVNILLSKIVHIQREFALFMVVLGPISCIPLLIATFLVFFELDKTMKTIFNVIYLIGLICFSGFNILWLIGIFQPKLFDFLR